MENTPLAIVTCTNIKHTNLQTNISFKHRQLFANLSKNEVMYNTIPYNENQFTYFTLR